MKIAVGKYIAFYWRFNSDNEYNIELLFNELKKRNYK